jgi:glycine betaine transporter
MKINPLLVLSLLVTGAIALWGLLDSVGLQAAAGFLVGVLFTSRAWFIMLTVSLLLLVCLWLMVSPVGKVKLGQDDEEPEFSTGSWISMLFAAGMGVGLLYWGTAEPLSHFALAQEYQNEQRAAGIARFITNFHWGFHAWAIYAITALVIAYFSFRKGCPSTLAQPICFVFGDRPWTRIVGWISDFLAIIAIAIGVGGSIAMGIFQIASGLEIIFKLEEPGVALPLGLFALLCVSYLLPLLVDLSKGMARLSNLAMLTAGTLMVYVLLVGQTHYMMNGIVGAIGEYLWTVIPHGFTTFAFFGDRVTGWFQSWTLTYMVWWLAWAPFVGIFIARISRGRTIRQFVLGVVFVPTAFSILWFGVWRDRLFRGAQWRGAPLGRGARQRRCHDFRRAAGAAAFDPHVAGDHTGRLSLRRDLRGERRLRAGDVIDRRLAGSAGQGQAHLGRCPGGIGAGDDSLQ